jgi:diguanylate cyclase (GGDEF)-like protein
MTTFRIISHKYRLLSLVAAILALGFIVTTVAGYLVSRDSVRYTIAEHELPLTSDNIYSETQKDIVRPVLISSMMAQDTFLIDWIANGEKDVAKISRYLADIKKDNHTVSSFFVSERTRNYYYADGILKTVSENAERDAWYFRVRNMQTPYELNVDIDMANRDAMTLFVNHRVVDAQGKFLGTAGVGLTLDSLNRMFSHYQERFNCKFYLTDAQGTIIASGNSTNMNGQSVRNLAGIREVADDVLNRNNSQAKHSYREGDAMIMVNSRFIPELGWYLIVEQDETNEMQPAQKVLLLNIGVSFIVTLVILAIVLITLNRHHNRLVQIARTDTLTGLLNRQASEVIFPKLIAEAKRFASPLSAILIDIDHFKQINDTYGHFMGDKVLREIAQLINSCIRVSDVLSRWGGEEFIIMLKNCPLKQALALAEKIRQQAASHDFRLAPVNRPVTLSIGIAQYDTNETETEFFIRTDKALYQAKQNGRNCIVAADETEVARE